MRTAAVDNDVLLKLCLYGLQNNLFQASNYHIDTAYFLGAARFYLPNLAKKKVMSAELTQVYSNIDDLLGRMMAIEPSEKELKLAAFLEAQASERNLPLDFGESQLCAIVVSRSLHYLITGDKRAIEALELLIQLHDLASLAGKVVCLEQLVSSWLGNETEFSRLRTCICSCPDADKTLSMCFSCRNNNASVKGTLEGLTSYINFLKQRAPSALAD